LPDPVGARINVWRPSLIAGQPRSWAAVGASNVASNQARVIDENRSSAVTAASGYVDRSGTLARMDHVRWDHRPRLRQPVLVGAFEGWNDAADASSTAVRYLRERWDARPFATLDPEEFFDFSATRPHVRLDAGMTREIIWPETEFAAAALPGSQRDVVVMVGTEPQLKWRTFCNEVTGVASELGVELVVTLGSLLADVAHTRPVRVTGTAADPALVATLGLQRSAYEGPTGIVGVLHDACRKAQIPSASLWAAVPHYVAGTPSPKAALALVRRAAQLLATPLMTTDLEIASAAYESQVSEVVEEDEDVAGYVRRLELVGDDEDDDVEPDGSSAGQVDGERLVAELERFLREQGS
jgi:proteasome assembly chaperone (PAC2) family protein